MKGCIAGAAILSVNAQELQRLRNQNDGSANTHLPVHFSKRGKKVGQEEAPER